MHGTVRPVAATRRLTGAMVVAMSLLAAPGVTSAQRPTPDPAPLPGPWSVLAAGGIGKLEGNLSHDNSQVGFARLGVGYRVRDGLEARLEASNDWVLPDQNACALALPCPDDVRTRGLSATLAWQPGVPTTGPRGVLLGGLGVYQVRHNPDSNVNPELRAIAPGVSLGAELVFVSVARMELTADARATMIPGVVGRTLWQLPVTLGMRFR